MPGDPTTSLKDRSHAHLLLIVFPSEKFAADKIAAQHPEKWKRKFFFFIQCNSWNKTRTVKHNISAAVAELLDYGRTSKKDWKWDLRDIWCVSIIVFQLSVLRNFASVISFFKTDSMWF